MRGRLEPKDTVERFWGLKFIGFPNLSDNPARALCKFSSSQSVMITPQPSSGGHTPLPFSCYAALFKALTMNECEE